MVIVSVIAFAFSLGNRLQAQREQSVSTAIIINEWKPLFDGKTLSGWETLRYGGTGEPYVENGSLILPVAVSGTMTGVRWIGDSLPVNNYVVSYEARRVAGRDIFAALTFPYGDTYASLIFSGWGGMINGLSSIDGYDASENETSKLSSLDDNQWYTVELRVTTDSIRAVVGSEQVVDIATAGKQLHLRSNLLDTGLCLWTYLSKGEIRNIRIKSLP